MASSRGCAALLIGTLAAVKGAPPLPKWTAPTCTPGEPMGGYQPIPGTVHIEVFHSYNEMVPGVYNHASMLDWQPEAQPAGRFLLTWKNGPEVEDQPGQLIMWSQSDDGVEWTPADASSILFPNMSTDVMPAALFAEPPLHVNGRMYAVASPRQFCLYPLAPEYASEGPGMLVRRVYEDRTGHFGPIFWANDTIPAGFELASQLNNVSTLAQMDAQTRADMALVIDPSAYNSDWMPCYNTSIGTKCEACAGGCQDWEVPRSMGLANERSHYTMPGSDGRTGYPDVLLYRQNGPFANTSIWASVRSGPGQAWPTPVQTDIPNQPSNINAGFLPDGRRFLAINPCPSREPIVLATTSDGVNWDTARVLASCTQLTPFYPNQDPCHSRLPRSDGDGVAYPQVVVLTDASLPPSVRGLYATWTNNKEDVFVTRIPLDSL